MVKATLTEEQIRQIRSISETLLEATSHLIHEVEQRDYIQTIQLFSSIVEGFSAIKSTLFLYSHPFKDVEELIERIEADLTIIVDILEKKKYASLQQRVRFSLLHSLTKLYNTLASVTTTTKDITIGVYYDRARPRVAYPEARIKALLKAAEAQDTKLVFFQSEDINFEQSKINGEMYLDNQWQEVEVDFPDVVHNIAPLSKHHTSVSERKLRRKIPFTSFGVGNKFYLPKIMLKHRVYADLLAPFRIVTETRVVHEFLEKEERAVLKPILGARGEQIYFIQKKGNRFAITDHTHERIINRKDFDTWLTKVVLRKKFSYMIQRYIEARTKQGEPFDIRAHMQKNRQGKWVITRIYPRIGAKDSILSNISRGGYTVELINFLKTEFGNEKGEVLSKDLQELAMDFTHYLDRIYNFSLDEIGLDFAIDKNEKFWLHEANNAPQSTYHEDERAVNTIGYCLYVAENGIVKQGQYDSSRGGFDARKSTLPLAKPDHRYRIGMLKNKDEEKKLAEACAYVAHYEDVQFYTFTPGDIDYNQMLIKGKFFEKGQWVSKIVEYPDVIYDRFRLKGVGRFNDVYEELDGIPFTNEFYGNSINKLEVYDKLKKTNELDDLLIPYKKIEKNKDIFDFIDKFGAVIVKPAVGSFARGVHLIVKEKENYFVAEKDREETYTEITLRKYLNELLKNGTWIVQQYINSRTIDDHPFDIRVHMMKDGDNEWGFVNIFVRVGVNKVASSGFIEGSYRADFKGFIKRNFSKFNPQLILNNIKDKTLKTAKIFSKIYNHNFNEMAFDVALDRTSSKISFFEININKPGIHGYEFDIARKAIPNAIYLAKSHKNKE